MSNDYFLKLTGTSNASGVDSATSTSTVNAVDNSDASIITNGSSSTMNYILSPSDLKEDDIELIKKELERKLQEQKEDLENAKNTRGWLTSAANSVAGWFGGGDKKAQNNISNYEALLKGLDSDISNIDEVYKTIMGSDLDSASLQSLKGSEALANSIDSETQNAIVAELENQLAALESNFETAQNSNGWISGTWNAFKNWTGIGASSNKASAEITDLKEEIEKLKNGEADLATTFKNITGTDLNYDNLNSLLSGEKGTGLDSVSTAGQKVDAYSEGQKMCTDVVADMVSGIASVGVVAFGTAIGICAAPFTAGASLGLVAAGVGLAAGTGALVKTAIKASDCIGNEKEYSLKDAGYDIVTGSLNGAAAPLTNALGGAAGTTVMKWFGMEALETTVKSGALLAAKEVAEEVVEEGLEQAGKKLVSTGLIKAASFTANSMVDGGLSGLIDGSSRALAEGRYEDILSDGLQGLEGGLIAAPIMGAGFNLAGKAGSKLGQTALGQATRNALKEGTQVLGGAIDNVLPQGVKRIIKEGSEKLNDKFVQTSLKNCLTISDDGIYSVKTNGYNVQLIEDELSEEILEAISKGDNTLVFNYANDVLTQELNKGMVEAAIEASAEEVADEVINTDTTTQRTVFNPETGEIEITKAKDAVEFQELDHKVRDDNSGVELGHNTGTSTDEVSSKGFSSESRKELFDLMTTSSEMKKTAKELLSKALNASDDNLEITFTQQEREILSLRILRRELKTRGSDEIVDEILTLSDKQLCDFASTYLDYSTSKYGYEYAFLSAKIGDDGIIQAIKGTRLTKHINDFTEISKIVYDLDKDTIARVCGLLAEYSDSIRINNAESFLNLSKLDDVDLTKLSSITTKVNGRYDYSCYGEILQLNEAQYTKAIELLDSGINIDFAPKLTTMETEKADELVKLLTEHNISFQCANELFDLESSQIKRFSQQLQNGSSEYDAVKIAKLSDLQLQRRTQLLAMDVEASEIDYLYSLNETDYNKALNLIQNHSMGAYEASLFAKLSEERLNKAIELIDKEGYMDVGLLQLDDIDDLQYERFIVLTNRNITAGNALDYIEYDEIKFEKFQTLLDKGLDASQSATIIEECNSAQYERCINLLENGTDFWDAFAISKFTDTQYARYLESVTHGESTSMAKYIATFDDARYERYQELLSKGIKSYNACEASGLKEEQFTRYKELINSGIPEEDSYQIAQFNGAKLEQYNRYIENGVKPSSARSFVGYDESQEQQIITLTLKGLDTDKVHDIVEYCDDEAYARTVELLENGIGAEQAIDAGRNPEMYSELMEKINSTPNAMRDFLNSDSCETKIKKATQGRYQEQLLSILDPSKMTYATKKSLLESGLSEEDLIQAVKKLSTSTYKLAMNTPNQYLSGIDIKYTTKINGKYPQLPENIMIQQQERITEFFADHFTEMARALKYIDADTLNQMMDKRTLKFADSLNELNALTDENFELLSRLTKSSSIDREGKALTAREKIQLCQIVEIYQKAGMNTSILQEMSLNDEVSLAQAKEHIQKEILKKAGISEADLANIPTNKLTLNQEYSYLALSDEISPYGSEAMQQAIQALRAMPKEELEEMIKLQEEMLESLPKEMLSMMPEGTINAARELNEMYRNIDKYTDEEILAKMMQSMETSLQAAGIDMSAITSKDELYTVIREATLGDFAIFISDETNIYGQANARTANAFTQNGINYEQWLKPDIPNVEFNLNGQKMTIKMWDRNPQEDLFMGNKTSCCTAIGTGGNAAATPVYLLNTSYNVVELYDEAGEVVGMSRIFMANVDGKPSVIMDNIELNTNYKDTKATEMAKTKIRDGFFEYMNNFAQQITGDADSQVYFYSGDIHVPNSDLVHKNITLDFVGSLSQETVYVNSAGCTWIDPTKLSSKGNIDFLVVPKK